MENRNIVTYDPTRRVRLTCDVMERSQNKTTRTYSMKTGRLRVNPFTSRKAFVYGSPRVNKVNGTLLEVYQAPLPWSSGFEPYLSKAQRQKLKDEVAAKWYSELANTNALLPLMFKERQKTIDLVADKVLYFARIRKNFVKGLLKHLKGDSKARHEIIESKWLEYRYGWLPTLADINTLLNQPLGLPSARVYAKKYSALPTMEVMESVPQGLYPMVISMRVTVHMYILKM